jgi:hypothetical protein
MLQIERGCERTQSSISSVLNLRSGFQKSYNQKFVGHLQPRSRSVLPSLAAGRGVFHDGSESEITEECVRSKSEMAMHSASPLSSAMKLKDRKFRIANQASIGRSLSLQERNQNHRPSNAASDFMPSHPEKDQDGSECDSATGSNAPEPSLPGQKTRLRFQRTPDKYQSDTSSEASVGVDVPHQRLRRAGSTPPTAPTIHENSSQTKVKSVRYQTQTPPPPTSKQPLGIIARGSNPSPPPAPRIRLRVLARAIARLLGCLSRAWRKQTAGADAQAAFATMRTLGGRFRLRGLPLCPQTAFADQSARDEISAIAPGLWQSNWRGAERVEELAALGIDRVISVLPRAEAGENPFPDTFRCAPASTRLASTSAQGHAYRAPNAGT